MKRGLFHTVLLLVMFASCNKPVDDTLEKITDTIVGKYSCKSATIQGYQLDLDGNGIASDDIIVEFERFEAAFWRIRDTPVRISPVKEYGEVANINIEIPKQRVNYDKRTGEYIIKIMSGSGIRIPQPAYERVAARGRPHPPFHQQRKHIRRLRNGRVHGMHLFWMDRQSYTMKMGHTGNA